MKRKAAAVLALVLLVGMLGAAGPAHSVGVLAVPGSFVAGYATPQTATQKGGPLYLVNADVQPHNVVAFSATRADGSAPWCGNYPLGKCPLFWSQTIEIGAAEVLGLAGTASGASYVFHCEVHLNMTGTLKIL